MTEPVKLIGPTWTYVVLAQPIMTYLDLCNFGATY
jgi:hypothetical protein